MARQRKPTALHEIQGTENVTRHRDRKNEPKADGTLGPPPGNWKAPGRALWYELRKQIPAGVATSSDKAAFELLVLLMGHVRAAPEDLSPAMASQLRSALAMFGLSPASRAALSVPPPRMSEDPASKFFDEL